MSPWVSFKTYSTEEKRNDLEYAIDNKLITHIPLDQSKLDEERNIIRQLSISCAPELRRLDAIAELERNYHHKKMEIMTIFGKDDKISSPDAMRDYDRVLHGGNYLIEFKGEGHATPAEKIIPHTNKFFEDYLIKAA